MNHWAVRSGRRSMPSFNWGDVVAVNGVGFAGNILLQGAIKAGASKVIAIDVVS